MQNEIQICSRFIISQFSFSYKTNLMENGIQKANFPLVPERVVTRKTSMLATLSSGP